MSKSKQPSTPAESAGNLTDMHLQGVEFRTRTLAYLNAIARYQTFSQASEALHISQPAISQAIGAFEEQLGVALLETQGRRKVLTPAGHHLAEFSTEILSQALELRRWLDAYTQGSTGSLRVGMIDAAVLYWLPSALEQFRLSYPQVELQIFVAESNALLQRLTDFEIDLAIAIGPVPQNLVGTQIATESLRLFSPQDKTTQAWALPPAASRTRALIDRGLEQLNLVPNVMMESRNPIVLRQMVALGIAQTVLPDALAEALPQLEQMRGQFVCQRTLWAVQRPSSNPDRRSEQFIELAQQAAQLP